MDGSGNAHVTGQTASADFPTANALDGTSNGSNDVFVTKFNSSGSALTYSTYLGGSGNDGGNAVVVDGSDKAYITGSTLSSNFPTASYDATLGGSQDAFVTKMDFDETPPAAPTGLTASVGYVQGLTQASLRWMSNGESDLSHYVVYRSTSSGFTPAVTDSIARVNRPDTTFAQLILFPGTFYFKVAAVDSAGNRSTASAQVSVTIAPILSLSATSLSFGAVGATGTQTLVVSNRGTLPLTVSSIALTGPDSSQFEVSQTSFTVNAGDSTTVTVTFSPTSAGPKTASLSVAHNASSSVASVALSGEGLPAVVDFSVTSTTGRGELLVSFTLTVQNVLIRSVRWTFGDGETSAEVHPQHLYRAPGAYNVRVDVTTEARQVLTKTKEKFITVAERLPDVAFSASATSGRAPMTVSFTSTNRGGPITSYVWNFGDRDSIATRDSTVTHVYRAADTYTVSLTATGPGGSNTETKERYIAVLLTVEASFGAAPLSGRAPLTVAFADSSEGQVMAWAWQFGDGDTSSVRNPFHVYQAPGVYAVSLTVTGPGGAVDSVTKTGLIRIPPRRVWTR